MDGDSSDGEGLMLVPAALRSGQTTPSRTSCHSATFEYDGDASHFQPHPPPAPPTVIVAMRRRTIARNPPLVVDGAARQALWMQIRAGARAPAAVCPAYRHAQLVLNPPTNPLPCLPSGMAAVLQSIDTASPLASAESAAQTANNTAVCTPVAAEARSADSAPASGEQTRVDPKQRLRSDTGDDPWGSPTHHVARKRAQSRGQAASLADTKQWPASAKTTDCPELVPGAADVHLHSIKMSTSDACVVGALEDRQLQKRATDEADELDACVGQETDLTRHPTLVFDRSPIIRTSTLMSAAALTSRTASTLDDTDADTFNDLVDVVDGVGLPDGPSCIPIPASLVPDAAGSSSSVHSTATTIGSGGPEKRPTTDDPQNRNSLFPSVVKQQSRCLSVLLQHGPHGGIRRIGPLLITKERGGAAITYLNPAFIDMMDVQPVDTETGAFLKKANIRRRSFSILPHDANGDLLSVISSAVNEPGRPAAGKRGTPAQGNGGPGMWWPLNDDNCSDEVIYDVHIASGDGADCDSAAGSARTTEHTGSFGALGGSNPKPTSASGASRKGSVSSQLRMMVRTESSGSVSSGFVRPSTSHATLGGTTPQAPLLARTTSDTSDGGYAGRQASSSNMQMLSPNHHLAEVTMSTESGTITRSIKCISLRLLVNRLASPEGNVDSDLMTDFLNSYRFFAHPLDVMRLIIIRYLNCFACGTGEDDTEGSEADDSEKCLTINGWRSKSCRSDSASVVGKDTGSDTRQQLPPISSKTLPPLVRSGGAIVQLRVMNIIKYWIKFHPHDFRLHHRLTRLLLLFLSHIQKQPGRAEFVNTIRQKLSSGRLLAVETPAFVAPSAVPQTAPPTVMASQATSVRSSETCPPALESTRSAIDLQTTSGESVASQKSAEAPLRAARPATAGALTSSMSSGNLKSSQHSSSSSARQLPGAGNGLVTTAAVSASRSQHVKKGSASYFRSLFHHRSSKNSSSSNNSNHSAAGGSDTEEFGGYNCPSVRIAQRSGGSAAGYSELSPISDTNERSGTIPNGNMYASDFGSVVMEALAKSGIPTPQTPVGRTLLNYSIANRNPYRINLVGIDPATFAEQLTLLEHELFARISATEFSLKGRVGDLETIFQTMQGMASDSRGGGNGGSSNPVPNLTAMTSWFNQSTYWAVLSVLSEPTTAARALVIKQLIHIAFHCLARRNYYGAFELAIALDNSAVRRLHDTWQLLPPLMKDIVAQILQVLQSRMNFRTYRESIKAAIVGVSGPDEEMFNVVAEQIKSLRSKDMISVPHSSAARASAGSSGGAPVGSGLGNLGAFFGGSDEGKQHSRKKSSAHASTSSTTDTVPQLSEQDCACITYAIRIRAASFAFSDPSAGPAPGGSSHSSAPATSKGTRGSGAHAASGNNRGHSSSGAGHSSGGAAGTTASECGESRGRRARSTSNSGNGSAGGKGGPGFKQGRALTNGTPLPLVPFIAVHMTDLLHADQANSTYSEEHQKMRSRNPTGPEGPASDGQASRFGPGMDPQLRRQVRCDSAAISNVNQAQPLLNMQKFRLITAMFRELHTAQRGKYPYAADMMLQQQIHSAVRNIKAQTNDIYEVVEDVAMEDPVLVRPSTAYASATGRSRTGSNASRQTGESDTPVSFGYPLYQIAALQKSQDGASLLDASMEWDCMDIKDNQELEQRLYMLSKWIEPMSATR
ncbi:hypothetical protein GGF46_000220 [Coemansia sp. RSA 552]|nr:hypothetical protein GGF46_000220 [Coemansia sp. RSA 552]